MAEKAALLAKSQADLQLARDRQAAAAAAVEKAEQERQRVEDEKAALEAQREEDERRIAAAKQKATDAANAEAAAADRIKEFEAQSAAAKARSEADIKAAEAALKAHTDELEAKRLANVARLKAAADKQAAQIKAAQEAAQKAHEMAIAARKAQEERQIADHAKKMAERKSQFREQFKHVWISGPTGISQVTVTMADLNSAQNLIDNLFYDNLVADIEVITTNMITSYVRGDQMITEDGEVKMLMTTTDERLNGVLSAVAMIHNNPKFDYIVTSPATGNKFYFEWVKKQTITRAAAAGLQDQNAI